MRFPDKQSMINTCMSCPTDFSRRREIERVQRLIEAKQRLVAAFLGPEHLVQNLAVCDQISRMREYLVILKAVDYQGEVHRR